MAGFEPAASSSRTQVPALACQRRSACGLRQTVRGYPLTSRWPWRLSLISSLSRSVCADGCSPDGNGDGNDGGQVDRCTGAQGQHESTLLSRQPRGCKASVLWIVLWILRQTGWSTAVNLWTSRAVEKWITAKKPACEIGPAAAVHKRTEVSTAQPVSSVIPATVMPADLLLFRRGGCPGHPGPCESNWRPAVVLGC